MISTPPLAQSFLAVTAGMAPLVAQFAVAAAETVLSLEPARIIVWVRVWSPMKARPTGTLVAAVALNETEPSGAPAGTSK